jgi:hypothetical protein
MENFVNEGIIKLKFWDVTGDVISSKKRSETHISSSASTTYIQNGSGFVNTPAINSSVSTNHEFWLKSDDKRFPSGFQGPTVLFAKNKR